MRGGKRPGAGRPKGAPNKLSSDVKGMVLGALNAKGGQRWLEKQMDANPVAFMTILGKVLPTTIASDPENPLEIVNRIELVAPALHSSD